MNSLLTLASHPKNVSVLLPQSNLLRAFSELFCLQLVTQQIDDLKRYFDCVYKRICPERVINDQNRQTLLDVFNYAIGIPGNLDLQKGLWLWGNVGTGKSTLLETVRSFDADIKGRVNGFQIGGFGIVNLRDVCGKFMSYGMDGIEPYIINEKQAFEEVGKEEIPAYFYKNPLNVFEYIIQMRYEKRRYTTTHVTTNLPPEQVMSRYDDWIYDRCVELFNFVPMNGFTFRK